MLLFTNYSGCKIKFIVDLTTVFPVADQFVKIHLVENHFVENHFVAVQSDANYLVEIHLVKIRHVEYSSTSKKKECHNVLVSVVDISDRRSEQCTPLPYINTYLIALTLWGKVYL